MLYQIQFFFLSLQVGFMTGPRPMTLPFILVASAFCWEVLFCCWPPCPSGIHATSNFPGQLQCPFCTKLPLMFRGILEDTLLFPHGTISLWLTLSEFLNKDVSYFLIICIASIFFLFFFFPFPRSRILLFYYYS